MRVLGATHGEVETVVRLFDGDLRWSLTDRQRTTRRPTTLTPRLPKGSPKVVVHPPVSS